MGYSYLRRTRKTPVETFFQGAFRRVKPSEWKPVREGRKGFVRRMRTESVRPFLTSRLPLYPTTR